MLEGRAVIMAFQSQRQFSSARTHTADEYSMGRSACAASPANSGVEEHQHMLKRDYCLPMVQSPPKSSLGDE